VVSIARHPKQGLGGRQELLNASSWRPVWGLKGSPSQLASYRWRGNRLRADEAMSLQILRLKTLHKTWCQGYTLMNGSVSPRTDMLCPGQASKSPAKASSHADCSSHRICCGWGIGRACRTHDILTSYAEQVQHLRDVLCQRHGARRRCTSLR
jgi:hypothetical protein